MERSRVRALHKLIMTCAILCILYSFLHYIVFCDVIIVYSVCSILLYSVYEIKVMRMNHSFQNAMRCVSFT